MGGGKQAGLCIWQCKDGSGALSLSFSQSLSLSLSPPLHILGAASNSTSEAKLYVRSKQRVSGAGRRMTGSSLLFWPLVNVTCGTWAWKFSFLFFSDRSSYVKWKNRRPPAWTWSFQKFGRRMRRSIAFTHGLRNGCSGCRAAGIRGELWTCL